MSLLNCFKDRRSLKQIGGCKPTQGSLVALATGYDSLINCSCGAWVPCWRYGLHQQLTGLRAYLRQVWASIRFWLKGPA